MRGGRLKHGELDDETVNVGSREKELRRTHTFTLRQPCVISARHYVAFQCIISAGKMPDMQNQILLGHTPSLCVSLPTTSSLFSPFAVDSARLFSSPFLFSSPSVFGISFLRSVAARSSFRVALSLLLLLVTVRPCYLWKPIALRGTASRRAWNIFPSFARGPPGRLQRVGQMRTSFR